MPKTYAAIINMGMGFFEKLFILADNIDQATAAAQHNLDRANVQTFKVDTVEEVDSAAAMQEAREKNIHTISADDEAQRQHPPTRADYPAERDLPPAPSTTADTDSAQADPGTSTNTQPHKGHQRRATTAPQTVEEALQRILNINLNEVTGPIDGLYHRAIRQYLDEGKPWQLDIDWAILTAWAVGVQEGRRRERQRRKRTTTPDT